MADKIENKQDKKAEVKPVVKAAAPVEKKAEVKPATDVNPVADTKKEEKKEEKTETKESKKPVVVKVKREEAMAKSTNMHASKKHCMYICNFIKGKPIDQAIKELGEVILYKRVIPMVGEIPHRSAHGVMSGRYPINASKEMIYLLKALKGNALANLMDLDKTKIYYGSASWASRPSRRGGTRFKRVYIVIKAKEFHNDKKPTGEKIK